MDLAKRFEDIVAMLPGHAQAEAKALFDGIVEDMAKASAGWYTAQSVAKHYGILHKEDVNSSRCETGIVKIGNDWPGVFIRGDDAFLYAGAIYNVLKEEKKDPIFDRMSRSALNDLKQLCERSNIASGKHKVDAELAFKPGGKNVDNGRSGGGVGR